ncbi:MAG: hypothetical protein COB49_10980 [Alphaproteobacteria bacterium]|nr:MAG: hypothetical protein COB49_10980 [Alphaproteobacteria bacterium]
MGLRVKFLGTVFGLAFLVSGCATVPNETLPENFDFGEPPENYAEQTKAYFDLVLKDPASAKYSYVSDFIKVQCHTFVLRGSQRKLTFAGWARQVAVNAKNSYGGYTGPKLYDVLFNKDGTLWNVLEDEYKFGLKGCEAYKAE